MQTLDEPVSATLSQLHSHAHLGPPCEPPNSPNTPGNSVKSTSVLSVVWQNVLRIDQVVRGMVEPNIVKATSSPGVDGSGMDHLSVG